ncbi:MAG: hypothetical protein H6Q41_2113 [Deltaproteobacteria bacterium]|nr:hypothetical protein [Deltaproteobacteria bacterium]
MGKIFLRILDAKFSTELTVDQILSKYIVVKTEGIRERGQP